MKEIMKTIWFKGKRKDNGEWVEGYYLHCAVDNLKKPSFTDKFCKDWIVTPKGKMFEVIPETVGQYIGLSAWGGDKLFEGDIITTIARKLSKPPTHYIIINDIRDCKTLALYVDHYTVVGNIHDNPEFLKHGKTEMLKKAFSKAQGFNADYLIFDEMHGMKE